MPVTRPRADGAAASPAPPAALHRTGTPAASSQTGKWTRTGGALKNTATAASSARLHSTPSVSSIRSRRLPAHPTSSASASAATLQGVSSARRSPPSPSDARATAPWRWRTAYRRRSDAAP